MMMPANFSVIAENEMTYVYGGAITDWLPDAPSMKTLVTNVVNIVANGFVTRLISATLGTLFGGNYVFGGVLNALNTEFIQGKDGWNIAWGIVGNAAAIYQLATVETKKVTKENALTAA